MLAPLRQVAGQVAAGHRARRRAPILGAVPLNDFAPATRTWFASAFPGGPTSVQERAWTAIRRGENALVVAPTGSGKTLAAFLAAINRLVQDAASERDAPRDGHGPTGRPTRTASVGKARSRSARASRRGVCVLYVSPLKALGVDVERNLRRPLAGITAAAAELGSLAVPVSVGVRSGDTPAAERRHHRQKDQIPEMNVRSHGLSDFKIFLVTVIQMAGLQIGRLRTHEMRELKRDGFVVSRTRCRFKLHP